MFSLCGLESPEMEFFKLPSMPNPSPEMTMEATHIILLSVVQGLTEFLPISSSGHLILTPLLFGYELQGLAFDVAVHLGTLGAILLYFRGELAAMVVAGLEALKERRIRTPEAELAWLIVLASLPVVLLGLPLQPLLELLREDDRLIALVIAGTTISFGLLLWIADVRGSRSRDERSLGWKGALLVGCFQAIAVIPGTSRSGIMITAGLLLGLTRKAASRFSFLLAIPTILMAGGLETLQLVRSAAAVDWVALGAGAFLSFVVAYLTIRLFLDFIEKISMLPFVLYRFALGALILALVL